MYNKAILIGNVGKEPTVIRTDNGNVISKFSLATTHAQKKPTGEYEKITTWHNIVFFGKTAETVEKYVVKGGQICVEGRISNRSYDNKEGVKCYITEIIGDKLVLLGKKEATENNTASEETATVDINSEAPNDDLPF